MTTTLTTPGRARSMTPVRVLRHALKVNKV